MVLLQLYDPQRFCPGTSLQFIAIIILLVGACLLLTKSRTAWLATMLGLAALALINMSRRFPSIVNLIPMNAHEASPGMDEPEEEKTEENSTYYITSTKKSNMVARGPDQSTKSLSPANKA